MVVQLRFFKEKVKPCFNPGAEKNTEMADKQRTVVVAMDGSDQAIKSFKCKY